MVKALAIGQRSMRAARLGAKERDWPEVFLKSDNF
jgi:hypothetical protein